jgi:NADH-quinone oxidoreductase subunit M
MGFFHDHILSIILLTPLVGALLALFVPREMDNFHRVWGNLWAFAGIAVTIPLIHWFQPDSAQRYQFVESMDWIPSIGAKYTLGIDGISLLLIVMTVILGAISILSAWNAIQPRKKEFYILFLILQTGMLGVFMSLDFFLFYVFWELTLVPMYFLIGIWGSERRLYAAIKFFLYTLAGSVLLLLAILGMYFKVHDMTGVYTFDIQALTAAASTFAPALQKLLFWGMFFAFAIKVPMFPFHTWLPDAHTEAPTAGSVILAGVMLKMGAYGFLRFSIPMLPDAAHGAQRLIAILSLIAIVYGALVCMMQKDMKKLIAYSSVSHMGFVTLGLFMLNPSGIGGSVLQQINHGISTGALFLIVGVLYERRHTRLISEFGGLSTPMPNFAALYMIVSLSSLGLPLLNGFIGEFIILRGVFEVSHTWAVWAVTGIVLGAAYLLWLYQRVMFGPITNPVNANLPDLNLREYATLVPLILWAFWIGIYPKPFFHYLDKPVERIVRQVTPNYYGDAPPSTTGVTPALPTMKDMPGMDMTMPAATPPTAPPDSPSKESH